jgi:hypothetical protein
MNAPQPVLGNSPDMPPAARRAALQRQLMVSQGMTYEEAYALQTAHLNGRGKLPESKQPTTNREAALAERLMVMIEQNPGSTRLQLAGLLGISIYQFDSAITRLRTAGRAHNVTGKLGIASKYYPGVKV